MIKINKLFSRIWGKGYNDRISLFLMANAICVVMIISKIIPIPFLGMIYLAITFLLVNFRYKMITIAIFEAWGVYFLMYGGAKFNVVVMPMLDGILSVVGVKELTTVAEYNDMIIVGSKAIMKGYYITTFIGYSLGILMLFLVTSVIMDWAFKIRKRAGI